MYNLNVYDSVLDVKPEDIHAGKLFYFCDEMRICIVLQHVDGFVVFEGINVDVTTDPMPSLGVLSKGSSLNVYYECCGVLLEVGTKYSVMDHAMSHAPLSDYLDNDSESIMGSLVANNIVGNLRDVGSSVIYRISSEDSASIAFVHRPSKEHVAIRTLEVKARREKKLLERYSNEYLLTADDVLYDMETGFVGNVLEVSAPEDPTYSQFLQLSLFLSQRRDQHIEHESSMQVIDDLFATSGVFNEMFAPIYENIDINFVAYSPITNGGVQCYHNGNRVYLHEDTPQLLKREFRKSTAIWDYIRVGYGMNPWTGVYCEHDGKPKDHLLIMADGILDTSESRYSQRHYINLDGIFVPLNQKNEEDMEILESMRAQFDLSKKLQDT